MTRLAEAIVSPQRNHEDSAYYQAEEYIEKIVAAGGWNMQISDEHFRGRTVIAADGQAIGEVGTLVIDTSAWTIVALQIKLRKDAAEQAGAPHSMLRAATIDLPVHMVQSVGDAVLLPVSTAELRQIRTEAAAGHREKTQQGSEK